MTDTAIILAAGRGSRLDPGGQRTDFSKPLISLAGETLLARTVGCCRRAGIERILVVTGFNSEAVSAEAEGLSQGDIETVYNPDWQKKNGLSLYVCAGHVQSHFLLMMSDHILDDQILCQMAALDPKPDSVTLAVDAKIDQVFDLDDATKVWIEEGRIAAISKQLTQYNAIDCGVFHCSPVIFEALAEAMDEDGDCSLSEGMAVLGARGHFFFHDIGDAWWQDVDTPDMKENALALLHSLESDD